MTTGTPPPTSQGARADITASTGNGVTAVTRNGVTDPPGTPGTVVTPLHGDDEPRPNVPSRGLTAQASSLHLRDVIYERSLLLADRFRVIRTIDLAAACFPEKPFKASLTAAQRAVRGMGKRGLLRRYRTDRFQTVYGLTQPGVDWLGDHGHDAASSVRRVSDMTNPEHRLWANFWSFAAGHEASARSRNPSFCMTSMPTPKLARAMGAARPSRDTSP